MSHEDDAVRAVLCAHQLVKQLAKINCTVRCGITTGRVFSGIVGTSGARREFSILGDKVNLAARLMGYASKKKK